MEMAVVYSGKWLRRNHRNGGKGTLLLAVGAVEMQVSQECRDGVNVTRAF